MSVGLMQIAAAKQKSLKRYVLGQKAKKVFAIGENKSGTTSLHVIFQQLGYKSYHGTQWRDTSNTKIFFRHDCFCDGVPDDFRKLDRMFPKARFILQVRDLDTWIDSRLEHIRRRPEGKPSNPNWTFTESAVRKWIVRRNAHHIDVMTYFRDRPQDLLLINYLRDPQAADKIASFLGHAFSGEKPHANRDPVPVGEKKLKNADMIASALHDLKIPETEWSNDIHCPSLATPGFELVPSDTALRHS